MISYFFDDLFKRLKTGCLTFTIKGGSRRAEKSRKVLMMMMLKAAKLGWAGPGAGQKQNRSGLEA